MPSIRVSEYYAGKSVFITGATGFMGKVLVEKLLRSCPDVKTIYIMVRKKKGQSPESRLESFIESRVFENVLKENPRILNKLKLIPGDILDDGLGMSTSDVDELRRECQIVFNNAACVSFILPVREAVRINTMGVKKILELAETMKKLEVFVHVSTAFCHDELEVVEEKVYPAKHDPLDVISTLKWMDDETLAACQSTLIKPYPNTYGYSKCLAEHVVASYIGKFPIAIGRPSIVVPSFKEPFPGWVDNINGPNGVLYAASRGVLHTMHCKHSTKIDTIPVDIAINGLILLAYDTALEKPKEVRVCNITQSGVLDLTWVECSEYWSKYLKEYPLSLCLWYPTAKARNYKIEHQIYAFLTHILPAYFIDLILFLIGRKPIMVNIIKRLTNGLDVLEYYNIRDWTFRNGYFRSLQDKITEEERDVFFTDMSVVDVADFMKNYVRGMREYYCKEDPSTLPKAKKLHKRLYILHVVTITLVYILCLYLIYSVILRFF